MSTTIYERTRPIPEVVPGASSITVTATSDREVVEIVWQRDDRATAGKPPLRIVLMAEDVEGIAAGLAQLVATRTQAAPDVER